MQAAIDPAEGKKRELLAVHPVTRQSAKARSVLPNAAPLYREQIKNGLEGDDRETQKARAILPTLCGGKVKPSPESFWRPTALTLWGTTLVKGTILGKPAGTVGSGGEIEAVPQTVRRVRLKGQGSCGTTMSIPPARSCRAACPFLTPTGPSRPAANGKQKSTDPSLRRLNGKRHRTSQPA